MLSIANKATSHYIHMLRLLCSGYGRGSRSDTLSSANLSRTTAGGEKKLDGLNLSASGNIACATGHDPARGHSGNGNRAVPLGGATQTQPGFRNAPSLRYLKQNPAFFFDTEDPPNGGFNRAAGHKPQQNKSVARFLHSQQQARDAEGSRRVLRAAYQRETLRPHAWASASFE